jgi:hypothetical protein
MVLCSGSFREDDVLRTLGWPALNFRRSNCGLILRDISLEASLIASLRPTASLCRFTQILHDKPPKSKRPAPNNSSHRDGSRYLAVRLIIVQLEIFIAHGKEPFQTSQAVFLVNDL